MRKTVRFFSFRLLLTLGVATAVCNSCKKDNPVPVTGISLEAQSFVLIVGEDSTLTATVTPGNATDKTVKWTSNDNTIASVNNNGKVIGQAPGTATITAKAGNKTASCVVTVSYFDGGMMINGVRWATRNVASPGAFADLPEDPGMFYQWNRKTAWPATGEVTAWDSSIPEGTTWEKANDPCPSGWRIPTFEEIQTLLDTAKVKSEWVTENGVKGRRFTYIEATNSSIFLPATGYRDKNGTLFNVDMLSYYWSSMQYDSDHAYYLLLFSDYAHWSYDYRSFGLPIRCVQDVKK